MTWLETSSVVPSSASRWNSAHRSRRSTGSRPTVGSSSTSSSGSPSRATASEARERWPPDSRPTSESAWSTRSTRSSACSAGVLRRPQHPGEEAQVLGHGEVGVDARRLGHVAHPARAARRSRPAARAPRRGRPAPSARPTMRADQRALAAAGRTEQAGHLTGADGAGQVRAARCGRRGRRAGARSRTAVQTYWSCV